MRYTFHDFRLYITDAIAHGMPASVGDLAMQPSQRLHGRGPNLPFAVAVGEQALRLLELGPVLPLEGGGQQLEGVDVCLCGGDGVPMDVLDDGIVQRYSLRDPEDLAR
jgi:hypothetical protein